MGSLLPQIRVGNIGTILEVTLTKPLDPSDPTGTRIPVDLTTSTNVSITIKKPDKTEFTNTATIKTPPGVDGVIQFIDSTGVFDQRGPWQIRGEVTFSGGNFFKGSWGSFNVAE
ncbi:MAG TPA: hypothetical protein ENI23_09080 [bacterium]|nr:hypothetical protein [bacterium]